MAKVLITGGSRGIGAAAVAQFRARGDDVYFLYEKEHEAAAEVAKRTGASAICCDVADGQAVKAAFETIEDVEKAADKLLEMGVHRLFISLGADGIYAAMGTQRLHLPNLPGRMVNTTGCGDAAMAAIAWAYLEGMDLKQTALAALAAGAIAMESEETINPAMSATALRNRIGK